MTNDSLYEGREQTLIKHFILREYLCGFAHKIGAAYDTINYVDCFSGPWQCRSDSLDDTSFRIALNELLRARHTVQQRAQDFDIRCFFLEKNREAYQRLDDYARTVRTAEVRTANQAFEDAIPEIQAFVKQGGSRAFTFLFIDP